MSKTKLFPVRGRATIAFLLGWLVALVCASVAYSAGNGTAGNPYINDDIGPYVWPVASGMTSIRQDVTPTYVLPGYVNFWSFQPSFRTGFGRYYVGIQNLGKLKGTRFGEQVPRSAAFSLFAPNYDSIRIVDTARCSIGADTNPGIGFSCAEEYPWYAGVSRRLVVDVSAGVTYAPWCPGGQTPCTVYIGSVAATATPSSRQQIGAWSVKPTVTGVTGDALSFLEIRTGGVCPTISAPAGDYVVPFKTELGVDHPATSIGGSDAVGGSCASWYIDWVVQRLSY